ncbi:MAG: D-alanyl-D-alanine carboxypeptidase [Kiritimatiellae bacterium]|nr:D-alanyl-D-alanine carboxypeptidase [Kiritimatiellia bacterium]
MTFLAALLLAVITPKIASPYLGLHVVDADNGRVLMSDKHDVECYPASCTKLMTLLLTLESVKRGEVSLSDMVKTTKLSSRELPSISGIPYPGSIRLDELLKVLMVKSANDGAVMIAEHVAAARYKTATNSQQRLSCFINDMNTRARELGMKDTHFVTPNGYPPPKGSKRGFDRSTAQDMAILGVELVKKTDVFKYTNITNLKVSDGDGKVYYYRTHNNLLRKDSEFYLEEADGLKTGFHNAGGCSLVLTAKNKVGRRVVLAIMGCKTGKDRNATAQRVMRDALNMLDFGSSSLP